MANEINNIIGTEMSNLRLNESFAITDPSLLVSHYKEKLSGSMKVLLMFNKELSHMKKKNEENEIENARLKLRIQHLEKLLSKHIAEFNKDAEINVCKDVSISPTPSSAVPRNCASLVEKVDTLCSNYINQDPNSSTPEISLPSSSSATNNCCHSSFILQNEISDPSVNDRKTFTKRTIIHSERPLSNQQNPQQYENFHFHEIKTEPLSPCQFHHIDISASYTNNTNTGISESSIATITVKEEKEPVLDESLVDEKTQQKDLVYADISNNSFSLIKNSPVSLTTSAFASEDARVSNNDSLIYLDTVSEEMDVSPNCDNFEHQQETLPTKKNISYVRKTLETGCDDLVDTVSSISFVQMHQTEAQYTSVDKKSSLSGDSTEAIIDESDKSPSSKKKQKRYQKKRNSIAAQTSKSQQRQTSSQCDLLIKKPCEENSINNRSLKSIQQSFSEGDISTEAAVSESELSENDTSAKPKKRRKRSRKRTASHKTSCNNEQIKSSVERLLKSEISESENSSNTETNVTVSSQSKYVKNSTGKKHQRKLEMKNKKTALVNIKSIGSPKPSHIEESDSSVQKPPRKKVKTLDSEASDDIPFTVQEKAFQVEIINERTPKQGISSVADINQDSDTKSDRNIVPKRKLRSCQKEQLNSKDSGSKSSRSIIPERKLRSHKKGSLNVNQDSDTESNRNIVPQRKLRSHKKREMNANRNSKVENNRNVERERKIRNHMEGGKNANQDFETESKRSIVPRRKLRNHLKEEGNVNHDSNAEMDMNVLPKRKLRSCKKEDSTLCVSNIIGDQSKEISSSSDETCSPRRKSVRKEMQIIDCDSSNAKANGQKTLNCHRRFSEGSDKSVKKCSENLNKETYLNEILLTKCIVSLEETKIPSLLNHENSKKDHTVSKEETAAISLPLRIENIEIMKDNSLSILPSEDAVNSLEEEIKFPVSSFPATNQEPEHEIQTEQSATNTLKDTMSSTMENCEEDLGSDTDDTPDINSDNISPESIYDDSDCDPDWFMDDDSFQGPSEFSVKGKQKGMPYEDSDCDNVPQQEINMHKTAKKSEYLSSKESTKSLQVKFNVPKKKKLTNKVENKEVSLLENCINSAIKADSSRKNETINKYKKLFWGSDADSDSSSELIADEADDKQLAENTDLNNCVKSITTKDKVCDLKRNNTLSVKSGGCVKENETLKNQETDHDLRITEYSAVKNCKNKAKKKIKIEGISSGFDAELIADAINSETLVLPKNFMKNNKKNILLVEDRIFGSDSSLDNEENMTTKECENNDEDNSSCHNKTVLKNNNSNDDTNSDFDSELIDEIISEELQLPEHLIINDLQKDKQIEDPIIISDDGIKITEQHTEVTDVNDDPENYYKTMHRKSKLSDKSDSNINSESTVSEENCVKLQLPESLHENDHQKILPIEDKVFVSPCSLTNICTMRNEKALEYSRICYDKSVCKINRLYSDSNDSRINADLIRDKQRHEKLQLPENDQKEFISVEDKIFGSSCSIDYNTITEKHEKVIEKENSIGTDEIAYKINKNCIFNSNSDNDPELILKEPNSEKFNLAESDHQKNVSKTDRMWKFTQESEILSSKENNAFLKTKSDLLQALPSCNSMKNIENATTETGENISVAEKSPICHNTVYKINKFYGDSGDSDIHSKLIGNGQTCEGLQLPENKCKEFISVEDKMLGSICNLENKVTEKCEKVNIEEGNSTGCENFDHKINKICNTNSNSDIGTESNRNEPNCEELDLPGNDHEKKMSVTDRMPNSVKESEIFSSEALDKTFCKTESYMLQIQQGSVRNVESATSETSENISTKSEQEKLRVVPTGKQEENFSVSDISINKMGFIIDEADNDELKQYYLECDLMNSLPANAKVYNTEIENISKEECDLMNSLPADAKVYNTEKENISKEECDLMNSLPADAKVYNTEKENISKEDTLVSATEFKILEVQKSGDDVQSLEDIVSEKNTFVEHKKEMLTPNGITIKSSENYNLDIDNHSNYAAELASELFIVKNYRSLNEEESNTFPTPGSSQVQMYGNENPETKFLEGSFDVNKSSEKLLQTNLQDDVIPDVSTKLNANELSSLSKINTSADYMLKANKNQFCTKVAFPTSHPKCAPVETLNVCKKETQTAIKTKKANLMHRSQKSSFVSANKKSVVAFKNSQHKDNLSVSLPGMTKTDVTKISGRHSENFHLHRNTQKYFKDKKQRKRKSCNEYLKYKNVKINPENPIKSILQAIDDKEGFYSQLKPHTSVFVASVRFNHCVKSLVNYLMHPDKTPDMMHLIYLVIKYLHHTRQNPLENCIRATEVCIVTAIFEIEKKSKPGFEELSETVLNVMHQFILAKNKMHIYGLASICRVFTEICLRNDDKLKPLHLCCDLLKEKHKFASILIISVAKVWKELFWISDNLLEAENASQISIAYGIKKSVESSAIVSMYCSLEVVSKYIDISKIAVFDVNQVIGVLKNEILEKSIQNSLQNSWNLTTPFVIFASFETWEWTKKHLIDDYIMPNLQWFSHHEDNEKAFDLFSNLYVDVLLLFPEHNPDEVLLKYFHSNSACKGAYFIQESAAVASIKHYTLSKRNIPLFLTTWQEQNQTKPKVKALKTFFQRRLMSDNATAFSKDEILISSK